MSRKRNIEQSEDIEQEEIEEQWDLKKILIGAGIAVVVLLTLGAFLFQQVTLKAVEFNEVLGESTTRTLPQKPDDVQLPTMDDVGVVTHTVHDFLNRITSQESSQSGVGKIVHDIQNISIGGRTVKDIVCSFAC